VPLSGPWLPVDHFFPAIGLRIDGCNHGGMALFSPGKATRRLAEKRKILMKNAKSKTNEATDEQTEMKVNLNTLPILITIFKNSERAAGLRREAANCDGLNNIILAAAGDVLSQTVH